MTDSGEQSLRIARAGMGISHDDFFRVMPLVLTGAEWRRQGLSIHAEWPQGARLVASISAQGQRRIASLCLPCVDIELTFHGLGAAECAAFVQRFDTAFQKGGG